MMANPSDSDKEYLWALMVVTAKKTLIATLPETTYEALGTHPATVRMLLGDKIWKAFYADDNRTIEQGAVIPRQMVTFLDLALLRHSAACAALFPTLKAGDDTEAVARLEASTAARGKRVSALAEKRAKNFRGPISAHFQKKKAAQAAAVPAAA